MKGSLSTIYILRYGCFQFTIRCVADQQRVIFLCLNHVLPEIHFLVYLSPTALTAEHIWIVILFRSVFGNIISKINSIPYKR